MNNACSGSFVLVRTKRGEEGERGGNEVAAECMWAGASWGMGGGGEGVE